MARKPKYSEDLLKRCTEWVMQHGLYPQRHGATISQYCDAMGISVQTHSRWCDDYVDYVEAIKKANAFFDATLEADIVNSLVASAKGLHKQTKKRTKAVSGKDGKPIIKEQIVEETNVPPSTTAQIFLLKNINPERWSDRQQVDFGGKPVIAFKIDKDDEKMLNEYAERNIAGNK